MGGGMGGGPGGGPRRRQPPQYPPQYHQPMNQMYQNYMPYTPQQYYGMPPQYPNGQYPNGQYQNGQYQNGGMPSPGYMPYQNYARSPPSMPQYVPMVGVSVPPAYPRPAPQSPALSTPYQPPPVLAPIPPQTPSSTHSAQFPPSPTPPTPQPREPVPAPAPAPAPVQAQAPSPVVPQEPFRPPVSSFWTATTPNLADFSCANSCPGFPDPTPTSLRKPHDPGGGEGC